MKKAPSLVDVARKAKVNISTVSRTINQTGKIGAETQARVLKVMRELGYKPNRVARRLRARDASTQLLGLIIPNIQSPFFADLARGVEDVAYKNNFALLLCNYDEDEKKEQFYLDVMQAESVDGIILPPIHENDPAVMQVVKNGTPVVCVDRILADSALDKVEVDNHMGAFKAVEHIIAQGHRRIGFIAGPSDSSTGRERLRGGKDALMAARLPVKSELINLRFQQKAVDCSARNSSAGRTAHCAVCQQRLMTIGALGQSPRGALKFRADCAVATMICPAAVLIALTMVKKPAYEVGKYAASCAQRITDGKHRHHLKLLNE